MAGKPCGCALVQGRSSGRRDFDDVHPSLCAFSHAGHRDGGRYGWRLPQKSSKWGHTHEKGRKYPSEQKRCFGHENTHGKNFRASNRTSEGLGKLPKLDGVSFKIAEAQDGRECILATGNTAAQKNALSAAGFHWNAQHKIWWKYADLMNQPTYSIKEEDYRCRWSSSFSDTGGIRNAEQRQNHHPVCRDR